MKTRSIFLVFFLLFQSNVGAEMKKVLKVVHGGEKHWVGDGFPVRSIFSYNAYGQDISPFLLLDYAEPTEFTPTKKKLGVDFHPHRGFETVTIAYQGEVDHADSHGNKGTIGPGDVQWMTAARGVLHEEKHGQSLREKGGVFEMVQLWVNLPAKDKMSAPGYQSITKDSIEEVKPSEGTFVRVIAGEYQGKKGPAQTFTPINLWDLRLNKEKSLDLELKEDYTTLLLVLKGKVMINGSDLAVANDFVLFERSGKEISIKAEEEATLLLMNGEPINEPIAGYGPFVMNTEEEIRQAIKDFKAGLF